MFLLQVIIKHEALLSPCCLCAIRQTSYEPPSHLLS